MPSRHRCDACPSHDGVGGFFFDFEAVRTVSSEYDAPRRGKGIFTMLDRDITRVLSTVLIATTICNILSTAIFTEVVARRSRGSLRFISLATSGLTAATLFFGELIPKTIGVNLGVPRCRGAFTPSTRLVSIRRGRGWSLF